MESRSVICTWPSLICLVIFFLCPQVFVSTVSAFDPDSILRDPAIKHGIQKIKSESDAENFFEKKLQKIVKVKQAVDFCEEIYEGAFSEEIVKLIVEPVHKFKLSGWSPHEIAYVKQIVKINRTDPYIRQFKKIGGALSNWLTYYSLFKDITHAIYDEDGARLKAISSSLEFSQGYLMKKLGIEASGVAMVGAQIITWSLEKFIDMAKAEYADYWWNAYMQYLEQKYPLIRGPNSWVELAKKEGARGIRNRLYEFWQDPYGNAAFYYGKARLQTAPDLAERTKKDSFAASYYMNFIYPTLKTYFKKQAEKEEARAYEKAMEQYTALMQLKKDVELLQRALRQLAAQKDQERENATASAPSNATQEEADTGATTVSSTGQSGTDTEGIGSPGTEPSEDNGQKDNEKDLALQNADCSQWPGSVAVWNEAEKQAECECPAGTQWNRDSSRCVTPREAALEVADCSQWPGSTPVWNDARQRVECHCPAGMQWNKDATQCIDSKQAAVENKDCSQWPGTVAVWNPETGQAECTCASGTQWNTDHTKCIDSKEAAVQNADCSDWPGSVPVWNEAERRVECDCPGGSQWNEDATRCISTENGEQTAEGDAQGQEISQVQGTGSDNSGSSDCGRWDSAIMGQLNSGNAGRAWDLYFQAQSNGCVPSNAVTAALRNTNVQQPTAPAQQTYSSGQQYPYGDQRSYGSAGGNPYPGGQGYGSSQAGWQYNGRRGTGSPDPNFIKWLQSLTNGSGQGTNQWQYGGQRQNGGSQDYMNQIRRFTNTLNHMLQGMGVNSSRGSRRSSAGVSNQFRNIPLRNDMLNINKNDPNYQRFMQLNNQINRTSIGRSGLPVAPGRSTSRTGNTGRTNTSRPTTNTNRGNTRGSRTGNAQGQPPAGGIPGELLGVHSNPIRSAPTH